MTAFPVATAIPEQACPECGATLRRGRAERAMKPGDVGVCADCACLLAVGEGLRVERMTPERLAALPDATQTDLLDVARSVRSQVERRAREESPLTLWVVYFGARNHPPGKWVVRAQDASALGVRPHEVFHECDSLLEARAKVPEGLFRQERHPADDPTIIETWF